MVRQEDVVEVVTPPQVLKVLFVPVRHVGGGVGDGGGGPAGRGVPDDAAVLGRDRCCRCRPRPSRCTLENSRSNLVRTYTLIMF